MQRRKIKRERVRKHALRECHTVPLVGCLILLKELAKTIIKIKWKKQRDEHFERSVRMFVFWKRYKGQTQTHKRFQYKHMNEMQHSFKFEWTSQRFSTETASTFQWLCDKQNCSSELHTWWRCLICAMSIVTNNTIIQTNKLHWILNRRTSIT